MNWLKSKKIIITGASSGIGLEIAEILIKKYECFIIGTGRSLEKLEKAQKRLGENFIYFPFDVSFEGEWLKFASFLKEKQIIPNILINNAGVMPSFEKAETKKLDELTKTVSTDFLSAVYSVKYILPILKDSGDLKNVGLVNISSSAALCPVPGQSAYAAAKSALKSYTEALACESDFYVGLMLPGFCATDIFRATGINENEAALVRKFSMKSELCARKIVGAISKKRRRKIIGFDAKLMNFAYKIMPKTTPKLIGKILKKSNLELFSKM